MKTGQKTLEQLEQLEQTGTCHCNVEPIGILRQSLRMTNPRINSNCYQPTESGNFSRSPNDANKVICAATPRPVTLTLERSEGEGSRCDTRTSGRWLVRLGLWELVCGMVILSEEYDFPWKARWDSLYYYFPSTSPRSCVRICLLPAPQGISDSCLLFNFFPRTIFPTS